MFKARVIVAAILCGLFFQCWLFTAAATGREWTDSTGKYKIEAEFVSADNGVVTLKKSDGQTIHMPLEKLCDADRQFVKSQAAPAESDNPFDHNASPPARKSSAAKSTTGGPRPTVTASLPLPKGVDAAAIKQADDAMNDLFKSELADAKTPSKRVDLAKQLLQTGKDTKDDSASQFVLFRKAAEMAAAGGDVETALAAVEQMETVLSINAQPLAVEALEILSRQSKVDHRALAKAADPWIDKAIAAGDFETAAKLATVMVGAARSAKDLSLLKTATARMTDVSALREEQRKIAPAQEKLETTPLDPEANRIVGHFLCFVKHDWEHGLPMLSLGDDESLKKIAGEDLKENKSGNEMMALGDSWDALAHGRHAGAAKERADYWYRQALPLASGVAKMKLEKRLGVAAGSVKVNAVGMKLVRIAAGEFDMGEDETPDSLIREFPFLGDMGSVHTAPRHHVRINKPFYMGAYPVTVGQFRAFVEAEHYRTVAENDGDGIGYNEPRQSLAKGSIYNWRHPGFAQTDDFPVECICWNDAAAYCEWLSRKEKKTYRLPTSAQWEYACRAGTQTRFYFGDDVEKIVEYGNVLDASGSKKLPAARGAVLADDGYEFASPVGKFRPNAWGLYDMYGNVTQFVQDWDGERFIRGSQVDDPEGPPAGINRQMRGSGWNASPIMGRSAVIYHVSPTETGFYGFRVIRIAE